MGRFLFSGLPVNTGCGPARFAAKFRGGERGGGLRGMALPCICDNRGRRNFSTSPASSESEKDRAFYVSRGEGMGDLGGPRFVPSVARVI